LLKLQSNEVEPSSADVTNEGDGMDDRLELLEATLDGLSEGMGLAGLEGRTVFWNQAAESITGHARSTIIGQPIRKSLDLLVVGGAQQWAAQTGTDAQAGRGALVHLRHRLGHQVPAMARVLVLRDGMGSRIGSAIAFHPASGADALPRGDCGESLSLKASQTELEDRLQSEFEDIGRSHLPFGVLWLTVDQAHELRKTHGARACDAMLEKVEHAIGNGLRPGEQAGRWGEDEFLVISHERTPEMLTEHAQALAGLARTADFRWWGDRVSLTVSIGAAQADESGTLKELLERARAAMLDSIHAGGNHVTHARGGQSCLPS
jgi:diguanylate cyclase (GGDEF)-like protein/PAS domain S-box-containing protein